MFVKKCGAKARTNYHQPCRQPAMANGRCRLHGGKSSGPKTKEGIKCLKVARTKHGLYSEEEILERKKGRQSGKKNYIPKRVLRGILETAEQIFKQIKVEGLRLLTEWRDNFKTENLYLEFKRKAKADRSGLDKEDRLNLGKTISSFSNSEGGVVIWGIDCGKSNEEQLDSIQQLVPINDYNKFCAHLESSYSQLVSPLKKAVEFHPFPYDQNSGFVAQLVHKSDLETIMCTVSKIQGYYTRVSGQDLLMEHYQIVDAFSRKGKPNLKLFLKVQRTRSDNHGTRHIRIMLYLKNTGMHIAFYPFLVIKRISNHELEEISTQHGINKYSPFPYFLVQGNQYLFKSYQNIVVHPDLSELVCHFDVVASIKNYSEFEMDVSFGSQDFILTKKKIHINAMEMQNLFESLYGNGNKVLDLDEKFILDVE